MSTSVYELETRIMFDPDTPSTFYGFFISGSYLHASMDDFKSPRDRQRYVDCVKQLMPYDDIDYLLVAACIALSRQGNSEDEREWGQKLVDVELETLGSDHNYYLQKVLHAAFQWYLQGHIDEYEPAAYQPSEETNDD